MSTQTVAWIIETVTFKLIGLIYHLNGTPNQWFCPRKMRVMVYGFSLFYHILMLVPCLF